MTRQMEQPFGLWKSPISAEMVSKRVVIESVRYDSDGETLVWLERRGDRNVLVARKSGEGRRDLTDELNVRGRVGYGGGEFTLQNG
ncbi:MAG TPA: hypothetical protein VIO36_17590, partial [Anaerolineaceae bacterium]